VSEIRAFVGERFEVVLESVPGSGFRWEAIVPEGTGIVLAGEELEHGDPALVGGPASQRFRFDAVEPGEVEVRFVYRRPWEAEPPLEERTFTVTVEPQ